MTQPSLYRSIFHPRTYGLQTYTDAQLWVQALKLDGCGAYRGRGEDPGHILAVRVVPKGVEGLVRVWRAGDCAVNTETGSSGTVQRGDDGCLFVLFIEGFRYLGSHCQPCDREAALRNVAALWQEAPAAPWPKSN